MPFEKAVPVVVPSIFAGTSSVVVLIAAAFLSSLSSFACQSGETLLRVPESYYYSFLT